jgi:hypothetical protein
MNGFLKFMFQNLRCYILKNGAIFEKIRNVIRYLYFIFNKICSLFKYIFLNLLTKIKIFVKVKKNQNLIMYYLYQEDVLLWKSVIFPVFESKE